MPRFFFNVADGEVMRDPHGTILPGIAEAKVEALKTVSDIMQRLGETVWNGQEWEVWVTDESHATVCSIVFRAKTNHRQRGLPE